MAEHTEPDEAGPNDAVPDDDAMDEAGPNAAMDELLRLVTELDVDNERLRRRVLELLELMEDAVTGQVAGERRIAELEQRSATLEAELDAVRGTRVLRLSAPLRRAYGRLRGRLVARSSRAEVRGAIPDGTRAERSDG